MNWRDEESNLKICNISLRYFQHFEHGAALKIERKLSHSIEYASVGTVMQYILVISVPEQKDFALYTYKIAEL